MRGSAHGRAPLPGSPAIFTVLKLGGAADALAVQRRRQARARTASAVPLPRDIASGGGLYASPRARVAVGAESSLSGRPMETAGIETATSWLHTKLSPN